MTGTSGSGSSCSSGSSSSTTCEHKGSTPSSSPKRNKNKKNSNKNNKSHRRDRDGGCCGSNRHRKGDWSESSDSDSDDEKKASSSGTPSSSPKSHKNGSPKSNKNGKNNNNDGDSSDDELNGCCRSGSHPTTQNISGGEWALFLVFLIPGWIGGIFSWHCASEVAVMPPPWVMWIVWTGVYVILGVAWVYARHTRARRVTVDSLFGVLAGLFALWPIAYMGGAHKACAFGLSAIIYMYMFGLNTYVARFTSAGGWMTSVTLGWLTIMLIVSALEAQVSPAKVMAHVASAATGVQAQADFGDEF